MEKHKGRHEEKYEGRHGQKHGEVPRRWWWGGSALVGGEELVIRMRMARDLVEALFACADA